MGTPVNSKYVCGAEGRHSCLPFNKACSNETDRNVCVPFELRLEGSTSIVVRTADPTTSAASILKEGVAKDLRSDNGAGYGNKHPKSKP